MITMYGIPNCDTIKKARNWLKDHAVDYQFHDYKKNAIDEKKLQQWIKQVGWETLLNRRGMMWRKLDDATRDNIDEQSAIKVMLETPSIIKRPVLELEDGQLLVGFNDSEYAGNFK